MEMSSGFFMFPCQVRLELGEPLDRARVLPVAFEQFAADRAALGPGAQQGRELRLRSRLHLGHEPGRKHRDAGISVAPLRSISDLAALEREIAARVMRGLPPTAMSGLGTLSVSGRSLSPRPAARIMIFIAVRPAGARAARARCSAWPPRAHRR